MLKLQAQINKYVSFLGTEYDYAPITCQDYWYKLKRFSRYLEKHGVVELTDIDNDIIYRYWRSLNRKTRWTKYKHMQIVRDFMAWLYVVGAIKFLPTLDMPDIVIPQNYHKHDQATIQKFLNTPSNYKSKAILHLLAIGLYVDTLGTITLADVNDDCLFYKQAGDTHEVTDSKIVGLVHKYIELERPTVDSPYVFLNNAHNPIKMDQVQTILRETENASGIKDMTTHALRTIKYN